MTHFVVLATLGAAVALVPLAFWTNDLLALSLAGLVPLGVDLWRRHKGKVPAEEL